MSTPNLRKMGAHLNGIPVRLAFPASVVYTRPSHLYVKGIGVLPLHQREQAERQFPGEVEVVREEYAVAERARR